MSQARRRPAIRWVRRRLGLPVDAGMDEEVEVEPLGLLAATALDRFFVQMAFKSRSASRRAIRDTAAERLDTSAIFYATADREGRLFPEPDAARLSERRLGRIGDGEIVDVSWQSRFVPLQSVHREYLRAWPQNLRANARWFRHPQPRPVILCLHGWSAGRFGFETRAFRVPWLYARGFDVVLFQLPFHGRRGRAGLGPPPFPSADPIRTHETFAQAIHDLRALIRTLRERGAPAIGAFGKSLGAYTTSLLATTEPNLAFAVPMIPLGSLADLMWESGRGTPARRAAEEAGISKARFTAAFQPTAPLARQPLVAPGRVLVLPGERDEVIPIRHAEWLAEHFDARLEPFPGCHLSGGREEAFRSLDRFLDELGLG
jgi:pimeloyl-ACP methyl ester carboxylesterase